MRQTKENITSKCLGVSFATSQMAWRAQTTIYKGRDVFLGYFKSEPLAFRAVLMTKILLQKGLKFTSGIETRKALNEALKKI